MYGQIGASTFSKVYRTRRRSMIEFVAMRKVEKHHGNAVMHEVRALHALNHHPNVMRFHAWYTTSNHIWVVTEYCAGGTLQQLLSQDGPLPESTVISFGLDVLAGMQHAHCHGVYVVDVRPRGILIDEYGLLKLSNFGQARPNMDSTVSNPEWLSDAFGMRDAPSYIAPELHAPGGVHSFASEF